jgi:prepilin-type N-terminal cleavage/methylation domain-containing protein
MPAKEEMKNSHNNKNQAGFSLIELLIAMTITLVIASVASSLVGSSFRIRAREDTRSDAVADAQRALNIVSREIANSGFGLMDNGLVAGDCNSASIRFRANLNAYTRDGAGNPAAGSKEIADADEDIKYTMYNDDAQNRHYLVRYDVVMGAGNPRNGTTVLANRIDNFVLTYFDSAGNPLAVDATPTEVSKVWKIRITVAVTLPAEGAPGSDGHQPASTIQLVSDVVLRNASQITY